MPIIYLSPSTQEWNHFTGGGTEEYYMNLIADAMIPYLRSSGIRYVRNTPDMTAASSIAASNAGTYDLHVALHSNAAPEAEAGQRRGAEVYYDARSRSGKRAADIIAANLQRIYPLPNSVRALTTTGLGEVTRTRAPAVLIEFAYHDNPQDADWIRNNIHAIAETTVRALTEYFGIPFVHPQPPQTGFVRTQGSPLRIRSLPSTTAPVLGRLYNGQRLTVVGQYGDWYVVDAHGLVGYADRDYIEV